jgi:uncharacterized membrane protein YoaT (DUF817 family)
MTEVTSTAVQTGERRRDRWLKWLTAVSARRLLPLPFGRFWHEFLLFGVKQAWACLFAGALLTAIFASKFWYPEWMPVTRYDALFLFAIAMQGFLLAMRFEHLPEAKVIAIFHIAGTIMELFKTAKGSWTYPEASFIRITGVPLFSGFMYSAVGSYIARCWRLFDFRFSNYPEPVWAFALAAGIYLNFFTHHYFIDARYVLFVATLAIYGRTWIHFTCDEVPRRMPLVLGFFLVALFIWFAENIGSFSAVWLYPHQAQTWLPVTFGKLGSWFLLVIVSFVLVTTVHRPRPPSG